MLQSGFQKAEVLGVIPLPPLPDQDLPTAQRQLETFRSEAGVILAEANAADDLTAPLAVAAAEAENLTLNQLGRGLQLHIVVHTVYTTLLDVQQVLCSVDKPSSLLPLCFWMPFLNAIHDGAYLYHTSVKCSCRVQRRHCQSQNAQSARRSSQGKGRCVHHVGGQQGACPSNPAWHQICPT